MKVNIYFIFVVIVVSFFLSSCASRDGRTNYRVGPVSSWVNPDLQQAKIRKKESWVNPDKNRENKKSKRRIYKRTTNWRKVLKEVNDKKRVCDAIKFKDTKIWCQRCRHSLVDNLYCGMNGYK